MKRIFTLIAIFVIVEMTSLSFAQIHIPSSSRSRRAIANVSPALKKALSVASLKYGDPIFIRIFKEEKELEVWIKNDARYKIFKTYTVCTYGYGELGPKRNEGDGQAPEGFYFVTSSSLNPVSNFHLSLNIGYPNRYDRVHNWTGSAIMIHGSCVSIGCYAMMDNGIEEIYALSDAALRNGQRFFRVHIFPFKMNGENMKRHEASEWYSFWYNLKEGYDLFETNGYIPPSVEVKKGRYVFDQK